MQQSERKRERETTRSGFTYELMNLLFSPAGAIYTTPKYGGSVFMERGNNVHVVHTPPCVERFATVALTK